MYVVTGASGHTGHVVADRLLAEEKKVRVIGRSLERLQPLIDRGADAWICDLADQVSLAQAFAETEAVYILIPPDLSATDYRSSQERISDALAVAIRDAGVKQVITLSSIGADKATGTGPVVGLHNLERKLIEISGLNALHLRAGYFMENTLVQIGIIKALGVAAGPLRAELELPLIATQDIGEFAAEALLRRNFSGHQTRELQGARNVSMAEVASIIGRAIGRPHLSYKQLPDDQVREALLQAGMSQDVADLVIEMSHAMNSGHLVALEERSKENTTPTTYEEFVKQVFAPQFKGKPAAA